MRLFRCHRRTGISVLLLSLITSGLVGCSSTDDRPEPTPPPVDAATAHAGWMRRIDAAVDSGFAPDGLLARALAHPDPWVRREAARAVGVLAPADAVTLLVAHVDRPEDLAVRFAALTSLATLKRGESLPALRALLADDPDPEVRRRAAFAVGRLEGEEIAPLAVPVLISALDDPSNAVRGSAALAVWHLGEPAAAAIDPLAAMLSDRDVEVRWRAAYALMRIDDARTHAPLRPLLAASDRRERTFAAWGMRQPVDREAVRALANVLEDPISAWTARVEALRSLGAIAEAHPDRRDAVRDVVITHRMRETHTGVLSVLTSVLGTFAGEIEMPFLVSAVEGGDRPVRRAAIVALAKAAGEDAMPTLQIVAASKDPLVRASAATGLGEVGVAGCAILTGLLRDSDARVRTAAAEAIATVETSSRFPLLRTAASDPDLSVRSTVAGAFAKERPKGWIEVLVEMWNTSQAPEFWELRHSILEALGEHAPTRAESLARAAIRDPFLTVRLAASKILEVAPLGSEVAPPPRTLPYPRLDDRFAVDTPVHASIVIDRTGRRLGTLVIELYLEDAPRHVTGFVATARQGGFDGLPFHRVVPSFVIQGADPRGDGWGDAGYHLIDEIHGAEYLRGTIGMPKAGDHTGGSQIFITHLPTPHLDGRYTIFGRVIEGLEVIDLVEVGDTITEVRIDEGSLPGGDARRATF